MYVNLSDFCVFCVSYMSHVSLKLTFMMLKSYFHRQKNQNNDTDSTL